MAVFGLWLPVGVTLSFLKKIVAGVPRASSRNLALMRGVGRNREYTLSTSSGMLISRCCDTSCSSSPMGEKGSERFQGNGLAVGGAEHGGNRLGQGWLDIEPFLGYLPGGELKDPVVRHGRLLEKRLRRGTRPLFCGMGPRQNAHSTRAKKKTRLVPGSFDKKTAGGHPLSIRGRETACGLSFRWRPFRRTAVSSP